uniref:Uncharacterized protein n=1 Tax=Branchiostoma floridae TaxID=7739 RepID=C3YM72_BRAFL|eukprot:XP_002602654.1 hypothetical protein BRAFLDRAFT_81935 [Branchiostoma floridae]
MQAPAVVLATDAYLTDKLVLNTLDQCRQVWEYNRGITVTVGLVGSPIFQMVSTAIGNTTGVAMSFLPAEETNTRTTTKSACSPEQNTLTNAKHDNVKNITCILLKEDQHTELFFTVPPVQCQTHTTPTTPYRTDTGHSSSQTHYFEYTEKDYKSTLPGDNSTLQVSTTPNPEVPSSTDQMHVVVIVSALVSLVVLSLVVLVWKLCSSRSNIENGSTSEYAHFWTIPPGVAFPGLLRSVSLPALSGMIASDDAASCRSLPAVLTSNQPTYCEIPDDIAAAHRPLPGLPHLYCKIPDDAISSWVRCSSLPPRRVALHSAASCRSLPAVTLSIEPTYSEIPDHVAAAQRPLPVLPCASWETPDHDAAAQRPLPALGHTYSEIPDDESGPIPFYADAAEFSLHVLKAQCNNFYRKADEFQGIRARRNLRTALASQPADQGLRTYVNGTGAILSRSLNGARITQRRASLPLVTPPNTYWPWEVPGERTHNTPRLAPLPLTLPNTYWPWELPGEGKQNTSRRVSLPNSTLPNTYWPWELPSKRTHSTPRCASLPLFTLPNTYLPWELPGEGTHNTPWRASLPLVTLPNTYWPWELPSEGTHNTPRRASLPLVTPPNTYWPWELPGEGTHNTPRRSSLPLVTPPNTYWPWEIQGEGTRTTPLRESFPFVTPPNTYWPWELPGEGTSNTSTRVSLPLAIPLNTYWP